MAEQSIGALALKVVNVWEWYQKALANPSAIGSKELPVHEDTPRPGYYRVRRKDSSWEPVGIFYPEDSDALVAYRGGREVRDINALWVWCCRQPVEFDAYEAAMDGKGWPDEPPTAPGIGDNSGEADPFDALNIEYLGEKEQAEEILKKGITTQADADRASIWKDRMLKIRSRAEALFKAEKQPILDEGKRIDDRWRFLAHKTDSETSAMAEKLRLGMESFLKAQKRAEEERQRKAQEAAAAAQREADDARIAVEKAKSQEVANGIMDAAAIAEHNRRQEEAERVANDAIAKAQLAEKDAEARSINAGRVGAKTTIRKEKKGQIVDYDAFVMAVRNRDEVKELMQSLAHRAAKSGFQVDGMKIVEVEKIV
ncbi:hypothetical protein BMW22_15895 [Rhizobium leguminosarum]|uniref:Uncharacterized protein n=1 Tax=Rhizobium leguminosarum TaxID=384 RepID=A0A1L3ZB43_RHILE|nr:hypothetical protein [Rhizobium leguminosarum]API52906.1 hypothetical protein BMW22_15895 [Rhizobium leguminosarum]